MPKAKSLKKKGGSCQVNFPISKPPCFDVDVSQYKSPCKHLPLDSAQMKAQTGGKKSARKNKKRNLRKNKKSLKKRKQKGGECNLDEARMTCSVQNKPSNKEYLGEVHTQEMIENFKKCCQEKEREWVKSNENFGCGRCD